MSADLIKALRCKEYFDLCNVESCRYHLTNTKSGCKCAIKLMATDAADALEAADKRIAELEAAHGCTSKGEMTMREHLFRAKRIYNNEWAYGNLVVDKNGEPHIVEFESVEEDGHHVVIDGDTPMFVIPETVGEYTGRDAYLKGKEIVPCKLFEGDICEVTVFDRNGIDTQHIYKIEYLNGSFYFMGTDKYDFYLPLSDVDDTESDIEVIGTIFDEVN